MAKLDRGVDPPRGRRRLAWVPPFIAGAAAATAAELAAGLLLYSTLGFLRALTVLLAVVMGAFGLGLWTASGPRTGTQEQVRRSWLFCLVAYSAAAAFSAAWQLLGDLGTSALARGLGLALLGALPMFAVAALLGSLGRGRGRSVGAYAAFGASAGFFATGFVLVPALEPSSTLLVCVIALSVGALLHGWIQGPGRAGSDSPAGSGGGESAHGPSTTSVAGMDVAPDASGVEGRAAETAPGGRVVETSSTP